MFLDFCYYIIIYYIIIIDCGYIYHKSPINTFKLNLNYILSYCDSLYIVIYIRKYLLEYRQNKLRINARKQYFKSNTNLNINDKLVLYSQLFGINDNLILDYYRLRQYTIAVRISDINILIPLVNDALASVADGGYINIPTNYLLEGDIRADKWLLKYSGSSINLYKFYIDFNKLIKEILANEKDYYLLRKLHPVITSYLEVIDLIMLINYKK